MKKNQLLQYFKLHNKFLFMQAFSSEIHKNIYTVDAIVLMFPAPKVGQECVNMTNKVFVKI